MYRFGWYGFNPGSQLIINYVPNAGVVGRASVTTTLSGAAGCLTCLATAFMRHSVSNMLASHPRKHAAPHGNTGHLWPKRTGP